MPLQLATAMKGHTLGLCVPREMRVAPKKSNQLSPGVEIGACHVFYKLSCLCKLSCDTGDTEDSVWRSIFSLALAWFHSCGDALTFAAGRAAHCLALLSPCFCCMTALGDQHTVVMLLLKGLLPVNTQMCWKCFLYQELCLYPEFKSGQRKRRRHTQVCAGCLGFVAAELQTNSTWEVRLWRELGHNRTALHRWDKQEPAGKHCMASPTFVSAPGLGTMSSWASGCSSISRTHVWITAVVNQQHGLHLKNFHLSPDESLLHILSI